MDITPWITPLTTLAGLTKAWLDARTSSLNLEGVRQKNRDRTLQGVPLLPELAPQGPVEVVISPALQRAFEVDIERAALRFSGAINDPRYTPADIDKECEVARLSICTHLKRIREFNNDRLPTASLERFEIEYGCRRAGTNPA